MCIAVSQKWEAIKFGGLQALANLCLGVIQIFAKSKEAFKQVTTAVAASSEGRYCLGGNLALCRTGNGIVKILKLLYSCNIYIRTL